MTTRQLFEIEGIFLHSEALRQAVQQYSSLFHVPVVMGLNDGPIYVLEHANGMKWILDDYRTDTHHFEYKPSYLLVSPDLEKAMLMLKKERI